MNDGHPRHRMPRPPASLHVTVLSTSTIFPDYSPTFSDSLLFPNNSRLSRLVDTPGRRGARRDIFQGGKPRLSNRPPMADVSRKVWEAVPCARTLRGWPQPRDSQCPPCECRSGHRSQRTWGKKEEETALVRPFGSAGKSPVCALPPSLFPHLDLQ